MSDAVSPSAAERLEGGPRSASQAEQLAVARREILRRGYLFWGITAGAILVTEALGAASGWLENKLHVHIPWPTISSTVGHLEDRWSIVGAVVVGVIAAIAFYALSRKEENTSQGRTTRHAETRTVRFYNWRLSIVPAVIAGAITYLVQRGGAPEDANHRKFVLGCVIYATFAFYGVILPSLLIRVGLEVQFPTLVYTVWHLRAHRPWIAAILVAALSILVIHLALYPWPDITREPAQYAGLSANGAQSRAVEKIREVRVGRAPLVYSTQLRGVDNGSEAWVVFFKPAAASGIPYGGCVVVVTDKVVKPTAECSK
jgi:hypothetical protein